VWLNGLQTVDFYELDEQVENSGVIGLQIHRGMPAETAYREILIQDLP
jgi:hypothetical protein